MLSVRPREQQVAEKPYGEHLYTSYHIIYRTILYGEHLFTSYHIIYRTILYQGIKKLRKAGIRDKRVRDKQW